MSLLCELLESESFYSSQTCSTSMGSMGDYEGFETNSLARIRALSMPFPSEGLID